MPFTRQALQTHQDLTEQVPPTGRGPGCSLFTSSVVSLLAALALTTLAAAGCRPAGGQESAAPPTAPQVTVAPVERRAVIDWLEFTGRAAPVEFVEVRPRVSGFIDAVRFASGQRVKKGDVLFVIDPRWHQADLDRREAEVQRTRAFLENAEREAKRKDQLLATKAISREEGEGREARYQEAKSTSLAAEAARDFAKLDLDHTLVRAPVDGQVSRALITAGNYVDGSAGGTSILTTIVSIDPIYVYADVDENAFLKFKAQRDAGRLPLDGEGKIPIELQLGDESDFLRRGWLESLDNHLDPQSGTILLRALFPNPDGKIVAGLFARIRLPASDKEDSLLVDESAIGTDQSHKFVLTVSPENVLAYRPVQLGPLVDGKRIIRDGLKGDERVVVNGQARVRAGMTVDARPAAAAAVPAGAPATPLDVKSEKKTAQR